MWYEGVTEEDIKVLNKDLAGNIFCMLSFSDKDDFIYYMKYGIGNNLKMFIKGLSESYEDLPLYIEHADIFIKWRLKVGK